MKHLHLITALEQKLDEFTCSDYPTLLGQLERLKAVVWSKMIDGTAQAKGRTENNEDLLTIAQVAKRLNVKASYAYELARGGKLHSVRLGKYIRVTEQALAEYQATLAKK